MMKRLLGATAALGLLGGVSACGLTGDLERPGPLIGNPNNVDPAELPDNDKTSLPPLPDRPATTADETEDELLGGPTN